MKLMQLRFFLAVLAAVLPGLCCRNMCAAAPLWVPTGPDGGDARRFAFSPRDPGRIYLGTTDSWIYLSTDGGSSWSHLSRLDGEDDLVVSSLVVNRSDPRTLYASAWALGQSNGGVFISHDQGQTWTESAGMKGQSVLALAQARSSDRVLVAGTMKGVYRSEDAGLTWRQVSPSGSAEIHEVESIAIDPYDPKTVYAGTWHLPWKTTDNGSNWSNIKEGLIDDSDVFSIIVDPSRPSVLFLSACSGIYRSDNGGQQFRKVQGIPSTARRTRVLTMDPADRNTVYAGTTEGLYKTTDGGDNWTRTTGPDVIVNDVYVDPRNPKHVLLATDRSGVLASEDGAATFQTSNTGFSQRQVAALLTDNKTPGTMYAGVINDKTYGGVFVTTDLGRTWKQQSDGLNGRDVFALAQGLDGTVLAGTSDGIFRWDGNAWAPSNAVSKAVPAPQSAVAKFNPVYKPAGHSSAAHAKSARTKKTATAPKVELPAQVQGRVRALAVTGDAWYAATGQGIFRSDNRGDVWGLILSDRDTDSFSSAGKYVAIAASGKTVYAARRQSIVVSPDEGATWNSVPFPPALTALGALAVAPDGSLWVGGREGLFHTEDHGQKWKGVRLPVVSINNLAWDPVISQFIVTSGQGTIVYALDPRNENWKWWNTGWTVHSVSSVNGRMVAASMYSGVVVQPQSEAVNPSGGLQDARK